MVLVFSKETKSADVKSIVHHKISNNNLTVYLKKTESKKKTIWHITHGISLRETQLDRKYFLQWLTSFPGATAAPALPEKQCKVRDGPNSKKLFSWVVYISQWFCIIYFLDFVFNFWPHIKFLKLCFMYRPETKKYNVFFELEFD